MCAVRAAPLRSGAVSSVAADGTVKAITTSSDPGFAPHVAWRAVPLPSGGAVVVRQLHSTLEIAAARCDAYGGNAQGGGGGAGDVPVVQAEVLTVEGEVNSRVRLRSGLSPVVLPVDVAVSPTGRMAVVSGSSGTVTLLEFGNITTVPLLTTGLEADSQLTSVVFSGESAFVFLREPARVFQFDKSGRVNWLDLPGQTVASTGHEPQPALAPPVLDAAAVARGKLLFESVSGCADCHAGPQGTNNQTVSVDTGAAYQVPRLVEFAWRAPWFHDGRMATLQDRFEAVSGGAAHGQVGQLTPAERDDLLEYLRSR